MRWGERLLSSIVWKYFGLCKDDVDQNQVVCQFCFVSIGMTHGNAKLFDHRVLYEECRNVKIEQLFCYLLIFTLMGTFRLSGTNTN